MRIKKVIASLLCIAVVTGAAGCANGLKNGKKAAAAIEETAERYAEALRDMDADGIIELTDWDDDDKDALMTAAILRPGTQNEDVISFYKRIASTISVDYGQDDINIKDGEASLKVKYVIVDAYEAMDRYLKYRDPEQAVRESNETVTVKGKLSFVFEDGVWKISKITGLDELFSFLELFKDYIPDSTETAPVETEPSVTDTQPSDTQPSDTVPSGTDFPDSLKKAAAEYIGILDQNMSAIEKVAGDYNIDPVGLYDMDGNGIPELYFFTDAGNGHSTEFHVYEYNEYMDEAQEVIRILDVLSQGQANNHIICLTDKELTVTYTYGETYFYHIETMVYDLKGGNGSNKWDQMAVYAREIISDYDVTTDKETVTYKYYLFDRVISESEYDLGIEELTGRTNIILDRRYMLSSDDPEYGLITKPANTPLSYVSAVEYLNTLL